jgi:2,3-bisphosphoglycerate-dependent phosphoglycerate mutase
MTTVYFIRHAQADNSVRDGRVRPLTEKGMHDRALVTAFLRDKGIDAVLSSPFRRAVDTVAGFAQQYGFPVETMEGFREQQSSSDWNRRNKTKDEFFAYLERQWADPSFKLSDGESLAEVQERNIAALREVLAKYNGKTVAIGTHATALCAILNYYDRSYGFADFMAMLDLLPWAVRMDFCGERVIKIEKINLF